MAFLLKKCPGCGSVNVVKIVYGYSSYELFKMPMQEKSACIDGILCQDCQDCLDQIGRQGRASFLRRLKKVKIQ